MTRFFSLARHYAEIKFGKDDEEAISKWIGYWTDTVARNQQLLGSFRSRTMIHFPGKRVLDIGCGTGGLSQVVTGEGGFYFGVDFFPAILEMARAFISDLPYSEKAALVRASGISLPFADGSIDTLVAFDVIEHLEGGDHWQISFLKEIRRVLKRNGILLLTTPNRLYPYEGHTFMFGPQYLPVWLADRYIRWKNPSFLQEHKTYGQVKLLTPWKMKKLLNAAGLRVIHDFPWGMDLEDYPVGKRLRWKVLRKMGLDWAPTSSFWFSACRMEDWEEVKGLKQKNWLRETNSKSG